MIKYKINVLTLNEVRISFTVSKYEITEGGFVEFTDEKTGKVKKFHGSRCEIDEVKNA